MDNKVRKKSWWYYFVKRGFDIFNSMLLIILLSWLMLIIALLVKLTSKGPVLFHDHRVGKDGKIIHVLKFRSMYVDAEKHLKKKLTKEQYEQWKSERKIDDDIRVTAFGKIIRRTSLDELPQLFNIFIGNMTFVGPRPITKMELDEHYTDEEKKLLLSAKPGLISYWSIMGRSKVTFATGERQRLELAYFEKRSLLFDFGMIFRAIPAVLCHKGAQ